MDALFTTKNANDTKIGNMNFQTLRLLRGKNDLKEIHR